MAPTRWSFVATLLVLFSGPPPGPADEVEFVTLSAKQVTAKVRTSDVFVTCKAVIDNQTGRKLVVKSSFYSAFDGLSIVVTDQNGKNLAEQPYTAHQSPYAPPPGREYPLALGKTERQLVFPICDFSREEKKIKVRLVGTLPG